MSIRSWLARENRAVGQGASTQLPTTFAEVVALIENEDIRNALTGMYGEMETNYNTLDGDFNELLTDYNASIGEIRSLKESLTPANIEEITNEVLNTENELESAQEEGDILSLAGDEYQLYLKGGK